jgi:hypothetical protein
MAETRRYWRITFLENVHVDVCAYVVVELNLWTSADTWCLILSNFFPPIMLMDKIHLIPGITTMESLTCGIGTLNQNAIEL